MKRKAVIIERNGSKCIAIDEENYETILQFLTQNERHLKKFQFIKEHILKNMPNPEIYDKEDNNGKAKGVTAMKFFKGQENARLYCKEIRTKDKLYVIVAAELHPRKKSQKLSHAEKSLIKKVASYEYEIIE